VEGGGKERVGYRERILLCFFSWGLEIRYIQSLLRFCRLIRKGKKNNEKGAH
jgi:hypothetical protein